jgi:hypothetical protein
LVAPESHDRYRSSHVGFTEVTELAYLLSQFVALGSGDEHQLVIYDSVAGCMCFGYGDRFAALYATEGDSHLIIKAGKGAPVMSWTNSM